MTDDLNNLIVLLDGADEQTLSMPSAIASADPLEAPLQTVYVTSLLMVEPKPAANRRNKIEQVVGDDFKVEDRLQVLNAMLPPPSERVNRKSRYSENNTNKQAADYKCDLCGSHFQQPEQYFGHLRTHSGEHLWECPSCPTGQAVFATLSSLRQHEKTKHVCFRPHQCALCPASYERLSELESHNRRIHEDERNHVCQLCGKAFYKRSDLRTHLSIHLGLQRRVCEVCGRSFSHVSNLIRHARLHTGVKPYPCTTCGRRFTQPTTLDVHRLTHENERQTFPCPAGLCSRDFRSRTIALRHARRLHPEAVVDDPTNVKNQQRRKYLCAVCGEAFEIANLLRIHESQHDELRCTSCNETFPSISELKAHGCSGLVGVVPEEVMKDVDQLQMLDNETAEEAQVIPVVQDQTNGRLQSFLIGNILVCVDNDAMNGESAEDMSTDDMLQFTSEDAMTLSADDIEATSSVGQITTLPFGSDSEMNSVARPELCSPSAFFSCCPENNVPPSPLDAATPLSDGPPAPPSPPSPPSPLPLPPLPQPPVILNGETKVPIPRLPNRPGRASRLRLRLRRASPVKEAAVTCSECGKHFRKSANLQQHMGTHFAEKQLHRCHVCSQTFAWKSSLRKHLATHFPEMSTSQKAMCPDCGREFSTNAQVQEHVRRDHLLERPHSCHLCLKSFYKKHDLVTHLRVHTKEKPYMCGTCGKTFTHVSHMKRHELIHRGVKRYECEVCKARFRQTSGLKAHIIRHPACSGLQDGTEDLNIASNSEALEDES